LFFLDLSLLFQSILCFLHCKLFLLQSLLLFFGHKWDLIIWRFWSVRIWHQIFLKVLLFFHFFFKIFLRLFWALFLGLFRTRVFCLWFRLLYIFITLLSLWSFIEHITTLTAVLFLCIIEFLIHFLNLFIYLFTPLLFVFFKLLFHFFFLLFAGFVVVWFAKHIGGIWVTIILIFIFFIICSFFLLLFLTDTIFAVVLLVGATCGFLF